MDDDRAYAIRAFYRLYQATCAVALDPQHAGARQAQRTAAYRAHTALREAGLLELPKERLFELVRANHPAFGRS
ncbi:hypothetical protein ACIQM4_34395 [Streptomyces sp. NPDC091272]|uniref:hypothetical protein n=1 Tax=Streptomyces sp. NPDC091272 TaxID=3365981 RepID=UPI0037FA05F1